MRAEVPQAQAVDQGVLDQGGGRLGEQHLPAVAGITDAGAADDVQPRVPLRRPDRFPRVHADTHPHGSALRPGFGREGALHRHCRSDCLRGAGEHHEERVPLRIDLAALVRGKRSPQQDAVGGQHLGVAISQVHCQEGTALDLGVQHREGAARQLRHGCSPLRPLRVMAPYVQPFSTSTSASRSTSFVDAPSRRIDTPSIVSADSIVRRLWEMTTSWLRSANRFSTSQGVEEFHTLFCHNATGRAPPGGCGWGTWQGAIRQRGAQGEREASKYYCHVPTRQGSCQERAAPQTTGDTDRAFSPATAASRRDGQWHRSARGVADTYKAWYCT